MIKVRSITRVALATLIVIGSLVGSTQSGLTPSVEGKTESAKLVMLTLTFADGQWARVSQLEGASIRIEEKANALALTPFIRDGNSVELRAARIVRRGSEDAIQAVESVAVGSNPVKLDVGGISFSVQVRGTRSGIPTSLAAKECCTRDCDGRLICGICVCTLCGVCSAANWCDCAVPGPID